MKKLVLKPKDFKDIKKAVRFVDRRTPMEILENCEHEWMIGREKSVCMKCMKIDDNY